MSIVSEDSTYQIKKTENVLTRSKSVLKTLSPFFSKPKTVKNTFKTTDRIFSLVEPSQKVSKVSVETLSSPFFQNLFKKTYSDKNSCLRKTTYAQPYFLWKTHKKSLGTPEFLIFERFEEKVEEHPNKDLKIKASLSLNCKGVFKRTKEGFYYLDISEDFIEKLFPYFLSEGAHKPFFPMGAHIPVISCEESEIYQLPKDIKELGQTFQFSLRKFIVIYPNFHHLEKIWALTIESEQLNHLREKYHLTSKLCSQDFMMILGAKPRAEKTLHKSPEGFFRINPAQLPA